jgi:hypothetical protein
MTFRWKKRTDNPGWDLWWNHDGERTRIGSVVPWSPVRSWQARINDDVLPNPWCPRGVDGMYFVDYNDASPSWVRRALFRYVVSELAKRAGVLLGGTR